MAKLRPLASMEIDDASRFTIEPAMPGMERPKFPYCLRLSLDEDILEKLDLDIDDFVPDGVIHGHFLARITSVSKNQMEVNGESRECCRVELQIEDMCVESEDEENEEYDDA